MAQKFFEPFKKLPQQFQNLSIIQKFHDLTSGRNSECFGTHPDYNGGCLKGPTAVTFEGNLGLLAIGTQDGIIKIYGAPGVVFPVQNAGASITALVFIPHEVRLLSASGNGQVTLFELAPSDGSWKKSCAVNLPLIENEIITSMVLGHGVVYIGSSIGTLRQIAVKDGRLSLGDDVLTAFTRAMLAESVPLDKREQLAVDASIVSLELQPNGDNLLIAYADGCVAVAVPQPIPEIQPISSQKADTQQASSDTPVAPTAEAETTVTPVNGDDQAPAFPPKESAQEQSTTEAQDKCETLQTGETTKPQSLPSTPVKSHSEKRTTLKLRTLTRGWRTITSDKTCEADSCPLLAVSPAPRVSHLLLRDQAVQYATWRQLATNALVEEVTVAYGDGAFQVWPITSATDTIDDEQSLLEPMIVPTREHPSMPYGPLPCGAITKLLICPSATGGVFTAFSGGLPRPEFEERHAVTVLLDQEHHVCFQFGSCVKDFFFIPNEKETVAPETPIEPIKPFESEPAAALLVLTERELVIIDLTQPTWPTYFSPYLTCLDASPVTSLAHVGKVPASILADSKLRWPVWGGLSPLPKSEVVESPADTTEASDSDLVLLGHADGSVSLLSLRSGDCTYLVGRIHTYNLFQPVNEKAGGQEVESWPPFRRVGMCISPPGVASFSDPRLAITQLMAVVDKSPVSGDDSSPSTATLTIVAGGAGGQVTVWSTAAAEAPFEPDVRRIMVDLMDPEVHGGKYTWAGGHPLRPFEGAFSPAPSSAVPFALHLSLCALIQMEPATAVTALAWEMSWHLAAVGTVFGFALVDMSAKYSVYTDFLLARLLSPVGTVNQAVAAATKTANSVASMQSAIVQRSKQMTVNMRQSFRRLKHLRTSTDTPKKEEEHKDGCDNEETAGATLEEQPEGGERAATELQEEADAKTVEQQPEEKPGPACVTQSVTGEDNTVDTPTVTNGEDTGEVTAAATEEEKALPEPVIVLTDSSAVTECQYAVGSLLFANTFVVSPSAATDAPQLSPSLWVGTSGGRVLAHTLDWEASSGPVTVRLAKELQLQHQASVLGIAIVNASANRAPVGTGARTRHSHEPVAETPAIKPESDVTEAVAAADTTEQPTDTAATPEAAVIPTPTPPESHQLLICSAEQVKLFALPTLRALHKHKLVSSTTEHLTNLLHSSLSSKHSPATEPSASSATATVEPDTPLATAGDVEADTEAVVGQQSVGETDPKCSTTPTATSPKTGSRQLHRKSLTSFALQQFTKACGTVEWAAVASRRDGKTIILALPTLRRQYKAACPSFVGQQPSAALACVAKASVNTMFWWCASVPLLVAVELGSRPALAPVTQATAGTCLIVPDWSRPRKPSVVAKSGTTKPEEPTAAVLVTNGQTGEESETPLTSKDQPSGDTSEATSSGMVAVTNSETINGTSKTSVAPGDLTGDGPSITAVGDVTVDSIKEYLNGDDKSQLTVKTIETSTEKHTLVEAGRVVTTLHETEKVDGKLVKDDMMKISSDDPGGDCVLKTTTSAS